MPLKTILFLITFVVSSGAALYLPIVGIIGYIAHYHIWPESQWWGMPVRSMGLRVSATFFAVALIGFLLNLGRRATYKTWFSLQEALFVAVILLLWAYVPSMQGWSYGLRAPTFQEDLVEKLTKILLFVLLMTRIVVTLPRMRSVLWALVIGSLYLGYQSYTAPQYQFTHGRLNGVGGPDFGESSFLGAHFVAMLPFVGIMFLRGDWKVKLLTLLVGGFVMNGFILTRTRAALLGLCVGLIFIVIKGVDGNRRKILALAIPALLASLALTDTGFITRMTRVYDEQGQFESSARNRIIIWQHAYNMVLDYPLGVGPGNFPRYIADYAPTLRRRDAHSSFVRCVAEWGIQGLVLYLALFANAFRMLRQAARTASGTPQGREIRAYAAVLAASTVIFFVCGLFMTNLYIEAIWWMLGMPVCLLRTAEACRIRMPVKSPVRGPIRSAILALSRSPVRTPLRPALGY